MAKAEIVAAGGVVWRRTEAGKRRILLVHRRKYDDWSFPKGKLDPGEHVLTAASREIFEETNVRVRLGRRLAAQEYPIKLPGDGGIVTKLVHYWAAEAIGDIDDFTPNSEVDQVEWVSVSKAKKMLSYAHDRDLLQDLPDQIEPYSTVIVLRHAPATKRKDWTGDDSDRPLLAERGFVTAAKLIGPLSALGVDRILSSDATRCRQTVKPLAATLGLTVELVPQISEQGYEHDPDAMRGLYNRAWKPGHVTVVCSHRPVLAAVAKELEVRVVKYAAGDFLVVHRYPDDSLSSERFAAP